MSSNWEPADYLVVNLARQIKAGDVAFSGVNSVLPMIACLLAKKAYGFEFTYLNVAGGVDSKPPATPQSSSDPALLTGSASVFPNEDFYDLCARGGLNLVFLGAAQIDRHGRTNVSSIGPWASPKVRLPGGGGAAVMMPTAQRVAVWQTIHSPRSLVAELDFVTAAGNVTALVTPLAVFKRQGGSFSLNSFHPAASVADIRECTGFDFDATGAEPSASMTSAECEALRMVDPQQLREAEVRPRSKLLS